MLGPIPPEAIRAAEMLLRALRDLVAETRADFPVTVEEVNDLEESVAIAREQLESAPGPAPEPDAAVDQARRPALANIRRRCLLTWNTTTTWTTKVLRRIDARKLATLVERCSPPLGRCQVCMKPEIEDRIVYSGDEPLCRTCLKGVLVNANVGWRPSDPRLTAKFLFELLSLRGAPRAVLAQEPNGREMAVADESLRAERLRDMVKLEERVRIRWMTAMTPVVRKLSWITETRGARRLGVHGAEKLSHGRTIGFRKLPAAGAGEMKALEESLQKREENPRPESASHAPVSAIERRWLFTRDVVCLWAATALHRCRMTRLADRVEDLCPVDQVGTCDVCSARELQSGLVFEEEHAVCSSCIRGVLQRANAGRIPGEPVMTHDFVFNVLSLHCIPDYELAREVGWEGVEAREVVDAKARRQGLEGLRVLGESDTGRRWLLALAPVATRLTRFRETVADVLGGEIGPISDESIRKRG